MSRLHLVAGTNSRMELASFLGVRQSEVSRAERVGAVPERWLDMLARSRRVNPEWIRTGKGRRFLRDAYKPYDTAEPAGQRDAEIARRLPTKVLADELARRISHVETAGE